MDQIKYLQIEMANFFRSPVNPVNFNVNIKINPKNDTNLIKKDEDLQAAELKMQKEIKKRNSKMDSPTRNSYTTSYSQEMKDDEEIQTKITKKKRRVRETYFEINQKNQEYDFNMRMCTYINTAIKTKSNSSKSRTPKCENYEIHRYNKILTENMKWKKKSLLASRLQMSKIAIANKYSEKMARIFKNKPKLKKKEKEKDDEDANNNTKAAEAAEHERHIGENENENENESESESENENENEKNIGNALYRLLFMFSDFYWNTNIELPNEDLFLVFQFLGKNYKIRLSNIHSKIRYIDVDFYKIFYIITDRQKGFFEFSEKEKVDVHK